MERLREFLSEIEGQDILSIILSGSRDKDKIAKVKVRPILIKQNILFQCTSYVGKQVFHENLGKLEMINKICTLLEADMKQIEIKTTSMDATGLVSKKGQFTFKKKNVCHEKTKVELTHNRKKDYILQEGEPIPFLVDLGVMSEEGNIIHSKYDKYKQINRFLEFIEDILPILPKNRTCNIIDFGCGKSYLTFAMYYYLRILKNYDIQVIGLDLKQDVILHCNQLKEKYGYDKLTFQHGDIEKYEGVTQVDMVVTLHACDTATDFALAKAVKWGAKVILSVPCCQHEINNQIKNELMQPILQYGLIKERMSALITDGVRAEILKTKGYDTQILEFIDMEHTPKNILIRAVKTGLNQEDKKIKELMESLQIHPTLLKLFEE
ncbi:MAG: SAM-dependent methyltransferase [Lachnospiraceae bacterium]|nr:SAM-dependent methyltransferase [Lachnospiraceae bacterium]